MQYLFNKMLSTLHTKEFQKLQNCNFINLVTTHFSIDMNSASKKWILYCWKVNSNAISSVYKVVKKIATTLILQAGIYRKAYLDKPADCIVFKWVFPYNF